MTTLASNLIRKIRPGILNQARKHCLLFATLLCFILQTIPLHATVNVVSYWRMGENDTPIPFFGGALVFTNLTDETRNFPLRVAGLVAFSTNVSAAASSNTGSTASGEFLGNAYATNNIVSTATDNFGIECWVNSLNPTNDQILAYNGHGSFSGWGLIIHQTNFCGLFGGVVFIGAVPVVPNVWTHLALVRANGTTTFFVNGVVATTTTAVPNNPATLFALGAAPQVNSGYFKGYLDEVRVFTFAPGQFSTSDLLDAYASFTFSSTNLVEGPGSGTDSVHLKVTTPGLPWNVSTTNAWLHVANSSGSGDANVIFTSDANSGATRVGILTIAGHTITITQAGSTYGPAAMTTLTNGILSYGVAVDGAGNVYIADEQNNAIKRWNVSDQTLTNLVASGLNAPMGVAVDGAGNVYIADFANNAIKEWNATTLTVTTLVFSGLKSPHGVTVDGAGNVYIADEQNNAVKEWVAASNTVVTLVSNGLLNPFGVAVDGSGNVYIADSGNNAIKEWVAASNTVIPVVSSGIGFPESVAVDSVGNLYIANTSSNSVTEWIAANNTLTTLVSGLNQPGSVVVDGSGNLYIADTGDNAIRELPRAFLDTTSIIQGAAAANYTLPPVLPASVNLSGIFYPTSDAPWLNIAAASNGVVSYSLPANNFSTNRVGHISLEGLQITLTQQAVYALAATNLVEGPSPGLDAARLKSAPGNWFVSADSGWLHPQVTSGGGMADIPFTFDANLGSTRVGHIFIGPQTLIVTQGGTNFVAGTTLIPYFGVDEAYAAAVDNDGDVFVTDPGFNAVDEWTPLGPPTLSQLPYITGLSNPQGLAVDFAGNIYIADTGNATIREWNAINQTFTNLGGVGMNSASNVAVDGAGNVFIANGTSIERWFPPAQQFFPLLSAPDAAGLAVDDADNFYYSSLGSVYRNNTTLISGLNSPTGVALDTAGNVYVADTGNNDIQEWNAFSGLVTTPVQGLVSPTGVAVDAAGDIFIAGNGVLDELPRVYVDTTPRFENGPAGGDSLPPLLTVSPDIAGNFFASSDQSWLAINSVNELGVIFSFTANTTGANRIAHIYELGAFITITQSSLPVPPVIGGPTLTGNGNFQFTITNNQLSNFTVLSTTNLALPLSNWTVLGAPANISPGIYQFTTPATNGTERFYRVRSP